MAHPVAHPMDLEPHIAQHMQTQELIHGSPYRGSHSPHRGDPYEFEYDARLKPLLMQSWQQRYGFKQKIMSNFINGFTEKMYKQRKKAIFSIMKYYLKYKKLKRKTKGKFDIEKFYKPGRAINAESAWEEIRKGIVKWLYNTF